MAGPIARKGTVKAKIGQSGKSVEVSSKSYSNAKAGKGRLYEDGKYVPKPKRMTPTTLNSRKLGR